MGDLSAHFSRSEFACSCNCGSDTVDSELLRVLEELRGHFGAVITITSAHRCWKHNRAVGGSEASQHLQGRAADIQVSGISPKVVQDYLKLMYPRSLGIGSYDTFTHVDTRAGRARWDG